MSCKSSYELSQKDNMPCWKGRGQNVSKCDTKGCIPLEVQIKRYLLAGKKLEELRAVNTFEDYDEAYKDVPIITQDMDITEILEYEKMANERLKALAVRHTEEEKSVKEEEKSDIKAEIKEDVQA